MEMSFTSAQFSTDLFALANDKDFEDKFVAVPHNVRLTRDTTVKDGSLVYKFTSKEDVDMTSFQVDGLNTSEDANLDPGEFMVTSEAGTGNEKTYIIKIAVGSDEQAPTAIDVFYEEEKIIPAIRVDNQRSAIGELVAKYPVYSNGDEQQAGGVKGFVLVRIFRCRATTMPGFDGSYKSAATNQVTFSTLESKEQDGAAYSIAYFDNTNDKTKINVDRA